MTEFLGRTIQIYLPTGEPRGIRIAELTTRTVQAILVPQNLLKEARERPELDQIAVYFLFGDSEEQAKPLVYIGQTEDLRVRLDRHSNEKNFWKTAVAIVSKTQAFTPAHIRWLEWYCHRRASEIGRYLLENSQQPREPFVTEPLRADCLDAFENLGILLTALGHPVYEPLHQVKAETLWFTCRGPHAEGVGTLTDDGFLVRKGAICRREIVDSAHETVSSLRSKLFESGVLAESDENQLLFNEDYTFDTPSGAAAVILGRTSNGWIDWKDPEGRTLHDVRRAGDSSDENV